MNIKITSFFFLLISYISVCKIYNISSITLNIMIIMLKILKILLHNTYKLMWYLSQKTLINTKHTTSFIA